MELTKEALQARRDSLVADYNAIGGAIQQVDWTLELMDRDDEVQLTSVDDE